MGFFVFICSVKDLGDKVAKVEALNSLSKYSQRLDENRELLKHRELIDAVYSYSLML